MLSSTDSIRDVKFHEQLCKPILATNKKMNHHTAYQLPQSNYRIRSLTKSKISGFLKNKTKLKNSDIVIKDSPLQERTLHLKNPP